MPAFLCVISLIDILFLIDYNKETRERERKMEISNKRDELTDIKQGIQKGIEKARKIRRDINNLNSDQYVEWSIDWLQTIGKVIVFEVEADDEECVYSQTVSVGIAAVTKHDKSVRIWIKKPLELTGEKTQGTFEYITANEKGRLMIYVLLDTGGSIHVKGEVIEIYAVA